MKNLFNNNKLNKWILSNFPKNYMEYDYIEPFFGTINTLFHKEISPVEIINSNDSGLVSALRHLRDEPKQFISKIKRIKPVKETYEKCLSLKNEKFENEIDFAINEFVLKMMNKNGAIDMDKILKTIPDISKRINKITILNKDAIDVLQAFDHPKALYFINDITDKQCPKLYSVLTRLKGKIIFVGEPSNEIFKEWNCIKSTKKHIWINR